MDSPLPDTRPPATLDWAGDALLDGYESAPIGPATLVRRTARPAAPRGVVLHVHGYNDYFFQTWLADTLVEAGYVFYAVDLRRAGRSLLRPVPVADGGTSVDLPPHFASSLRDFGIDLDAASSAVRALEPDLPLAVHAHSTGGLTAAMWAHAHADDPAGPQALVLDSPFLDLTGSWLSRQVNSGVLSVLGRVRPMAVLSTHPSTYATFQHVSNGGRWEFDTRLKKPAGQPARAAWLRAVRRAHGRLVRGLDITRPVLVARSATSGPDCLDNPDLDRQDTVLDTARIGHLAPRLGHDITELLVEGGVHDLVLSRDEPRDLYLTGVTQFLDAELPPAA